jgi:hypothetical protein
MASMVLERKPIGAVTIELCAGCQALWFDRHESLQLTPGSTLELFRTMQRLAHATRNPLPTRPPCPRCSTPMMETSDVQRTTRFSYWRCVSGHGRYTPFVQFMLEKSFLRPLPRDELERLKGAMRTIRCSGCGAPVELARATACPYCRAPIVALDPDGIAKAVRELDAAEARRHQIDVSVLLDGLAHAQQFQRELMRIEGRTALSGDASSAFDEVASRSRVFDLLFGDGPRW